MSKPMNEPFSPRRFKPGAAIETLLYSLATLAFVVWLGAVILKGYERGNRALIDIGTRLEQAVGR